VLIRRPSLVTRPSSFHVFLSWHPRLTPTLNQTPKLSLLLMRLMAPVRRSKLTCVPCPAAWPRYPGLLTHVLTSQSDSAFGDSQSSYTMSATSSVFNFRYENGRRYHAYAEGVYPVPNDEVQPRHVLQVEPPLTLDYARPKQTDSICNTTLSALHSTANSFEHRSRTTSKTCWMLDAGLGSGQLSSLMSIHRLACLAQT
jgi:hypothetical protein